MDNKNLPKGPYLIRVIGEALDETEPPINKSYEDGTIFINVPVHIGKFDTKE